MSILSELKVGGTGIVQALDLPESVQNHLMHMGFVPEARVTVLRRAPAGDPTVYAIDGLEIALRRDTASAIYLREPASIAATAADHQPAAAKSTAAAQIPTPKPADSALKPPAEPVHIELAEVAP